MMGVSLDSLRLASSADDPFLAELMPRFLPISGRTAGALNDLYATNMKFKGFPFEQIAVRTLVINAVGDTLAPHAAAKARAERIPGVRFLTLASGGHLLLGQHERVKAEIR